MIRRGFWLAAGAVTGIYGYRRVSAVGRRLSASLNPAGPTPSPTPGASLGPGARQGPGHGPGQRARLARQGRRGALRLTRETFRFTRDVREGMELYTARHSAPAGSTLGPRGLERARDLETNHDPRPKDGR
jgi:hypothetical protein